MPSHDEPGATPEMRARSSPNLHDLGAMESFIDDDHDHGGFIKQDAQIQFSGQRRGKAH